jgi:UDP-glucose 4-epimerase
MSGEFVVVTGGAGFIGSHVVGALLAQGHRVLVLDNFRTGKRSNLASFAESPDLQIREVDITEGLWSSLAEVTASWGAVDRVIHLAAQTSVVVSVGSPLDDMRNNYESTIQILEYARVHGVKKVVFSSSAAVYGDVEADAISESLPTSPLSPYGIHKLGSEMQMRYYQKVHGVATTALRFFNVYGPRQDPASPYSGVISIFVERAIRQQKLLIFGDGQQTRDFVYVGDVANAILSACFGESSNGGAYNIGTGLTTTVKELAESIVAECESTSVIEHRDARAGEILHSCADISQAREALSFTPSRSLKEGLHETIEWVKSLS